MWLTLLLASLVGLVPIIVIILGPILLAALCKPLGWYLQRKTAGRRQQILARVEEDEKALAEVKGTKVVDEDWENIDAHTVGTAENGKQADAEWDGVVGFFHPFWYAIPCLLSPFLADLIEVMLVEAENVSSGQLSGQHKSAGRTLSVLSTLVTMRLIRLPFSNESRFVKVSHLVRFHC